MRSSCPQRWPRKDNLAVLVSSRSCHDKGIVLPVLSSLQETPLDVCKALVRIHRHHFIPNLGREKDIADDTHVGIGLSNLGVANDSTSSHSSSHHDNEKEVKTKCKQIDLQPHHLTLYHDGAPLAPRIALGTLIPGLAPSNSDTQIVDVPLKQTDRQSKEKRQRVQNGNNIPFVGNGKCCAWRGKGRCDSTVDESCLNDYNYDRNGIDSGRGRDVGGRSIVRSQKQRILMLHVDNALIDAGKPATPEQRQFFLDRLKKISFTRHVEQEVQRQRHIEEVALGGMPLPEERLRFIRQQSIERANTYGHPSHLKEDRYGNVSQAVIPERGAVSTLPTRHECKQTLRRLAAKQKMRVEKRFSTKEWETWLRAYTVLAESDDCDDDDLVTLQQDIAKDLVGKGGASTDYEGWRRWNPNQDEDALQHEARRDARVKKASQQRALVYDAAQQEKERGNALYRQQKWYEAACSYTLAMMMDPTKGVYWANRAQALLSLCLKEFNMEETEEIEEDESDEDESEEDENRKEKNEEDIDEEEVNEEGEDGEAERGDVKKRMGMVGRGGSKDTRRQLLLRCISDCDRAIGLDQRGNAKVWLRRAKARVTLFPRNAHAIAKAVQDLKEARRVAPIECPKGMSKKEEKKRKKRTIEEEAVQLQQIWDTELAKVKSGYYDL